jgi:hypothetical protein
MIARRIFVVIGAFLLACATAAAIMMAITLSMTFWWMPGPLPAGEALRLPIVAVPIFVVVTVTTAIPTLLIAAAAEIYRLRSMVLFALAGVLVATIARGEIVLLTSVLKLPGDRHIRPFPSRLLPHSLLDAIVFAGFAATGAIAGLVYWRIAGRNAGSWRRAGEAQVQ